MIRNKINVFYGDDDESIYTDEGKKRLWEEEHIVYTGGVYACKVWGDSPTTAMIQLLGEDDGAIYSDCEFVFDPYWLDDLQQLITETKFKIDCLGVEYYGRHKNDKM